MSSIQETLTRPARLHMHTFIDTRIPRSRQSNSLFPLSYPYLRKYLRFRIRKIPHAHALLLRIKDLSWKIGWNRNFTNSRCVEFERGGEVVSRYRYRSRVNTVLLMLRRRAGGDLPNRTEKKNWRPPYYLLFLGEFLF